MGFLRASQVDQTLLTWTLEILALFCIYIKSLFRVTFGDCLCKCEQQRKPDNNVKHLLTELKPQIETL